MGVFLVVVVLFVFHTCLQVATFNSSYRIMWLSLIFCGSCAGAMRILLTIAFGKGHHHDAKRITTTGMVVIAVLVALLGTLVFFLSRQLGRIFSNDSLILQEFENIRLPFALTVVFMNLAVTQEQPLQAMVIVFPSLFVFFTVLLGTPHYCSYYWFVWKLGCSRCCFCRFC